MKDTLLERLLHYFQISEEEYLSLIAPVDEENFLSGHKFKNMDQAVSLVKEALQNKDKIFIYGDYDADGIMSTSIVVKSILKLGQIPLFYIPNRYNDGYGITLNKAEEIVSNGVKLVITVDNGVSAFEPIAYLKEHGVKVLVIDHHTIQDEVPNADVIIHPSYSEFGEVATSAGFVSFIFSWALLGYFDKYLSTLAAISVISDMMPLKEYNRNFLRLVFSKYQDGEFYSIDLLKEGMPFDENSIGLKIAPKINALGRLLDDSTINYIVHYFVTSDKTKIDKLLTWINDTNEKRKEESRNVGDSLPKMDDSDSAIVYLTEAKEGLLGLIANQICNEYHKPTIVFTKEKEGDVLKGSCRAPIGFNVVDAFNYCGDVMLTSGGHALAGGCSINISDLSIFEERFKKYAKENPIVVVEQDEIPIGLTEICQENYELIQSFSPFGEAWKAPIFLINHIKTDSLMYSKNGEHILSYIGQGVKLVGFNFARKNVSEYKYVDVIGKIKETTYRGQTTLEFNIKEIKEAE